MKIIISKLKEPALFLIFVLTVSSLAHFIFSSFGYAPSDDGFMLAYSRRIFDGQIPYKDFLSAQNIGTPFLFVPFIRFGGENTFWLTRFVVWVEFSSIAWIWVFMLVKYSFLKSASMIQRIAIAIIAFFFTAHSFPTMVFYTIDGILFYSVGLLLCKKQSVFLKTIGYVLVGSTYIIKQNFIFLLPATIFLLKDWRSKRFWIAMLLPTIFFYSFFLFAGGIVETLSQTTSRTEFVRVAIKAYTGKFTVPWGIILGFAGAYMLLKASLKKIITGFFLLCLPIFYSAFYLGAGDKFTYDSSFFLFGALWGIVVFFLWKKINSKEVILLILGVIAAWSVGISGGYNTPALASGILFICIITVLFQVINTTQPNVKILKFLLLIIIFFLLPITTYGFYGARTHHIYGEPRPASELTYKLDTLLPGGRNIKGSREIYLWLVDLHKAIDLVQKSHSVYALLPNFPGLWVQNSQKNPLIMDYPFILNSQKALIYPLINNILKSRGRVTFIVDKMSLQQKQDLSPDAAFPIAGFVSKHFVKIGETMYFILYR